jgi:hypothetical protein
MSLKKQENEEGSFRDYSEDGKLPLFQKNTDFKTDDDYKLEAFKNQEEPKKYLKNKASPLKKQMFKEDEDPTILSARNNQE